MSGGPHTAVEDATRLVASTYYGSRGVWLYDAFDAMNAAWFDGELPTPLITLQLTPHGGCLAWHSGSDLRPPRIAIHPSTFGGTEKDSPWGIPPTWLGHVFAFDALLHECIHASVHYRLGGWEGPSSHNNDAWIGEVNRLAPKLGFEGVEAGRQVPKRVPIDGQLTKTGKPKTKVRKVDLGNVPFNAAATFPLGLRDHFGTAAAYYELGLLPGAVAAELVAAP